MRYELKIVLPESEYAAIISNLQGSSFFIREIYHERKINNIYFDSPNYSDFYANLHGDANRKKYRIRWYGELLGEITSPNFELKYKQGLSGDKKTIGLPSFIFHQGFDFQYYTKDISDFMYKCQEPDCAALGELLERKPALVNRYTRRYFQTFDKKYRITIDKDLWYAAPSVAFLHPDIFGVFEHALIMEIKFNACDSVGASHLINELGYRVSRNSKYVNGIQAIRLL